MLRSGVCVVCGVAGKGLFDPGLLGPIDGASIAAAHLDSETCQGDGSEGCETLQGTEGIDFLGGNGWNMLESFEIWDD